MADDFRGLRAENNILKVNLLQQRIKKRIKQFINDKIFRNFSLIYNDLHC